MSNPNEFTTPVGRIVGGSVQNKRKKDADGRELAEDDQYHVIMLALPKSDPTTEMFMTQCRSTALTGSWGDPKAVVDGEFSWKRQDGDDPKYADKDGYAGNYVFAISNRFPFALVDSNNRAIKAEQIETGYWVRAAGTMRPNNHKTRPGIYLNLEGVQLVRKDEQIGSLGRTASEMFGANPSTAPSITQSAMAGAPPPPPSGPKLTAKGRAENVDIAAYHKNGWSDDDLRTQGYIE